MSNTDTNLTKVEKTLEDFTEKFEKSKNEASEKLLSSIKLHQDIIPELTQANKALFERINKILLDPEIIIPIQDLGWLMKSMSEFTNKHFASSIAAFKNESSPNSDQGKKNLPKPGLNPLIDDNGNEISKDRIKDAKDLKQHIEYITDLKKQLSEATDNPDNIKSN